MGDRIVFQHADAFWRIPAGGGTPELIATPDPERDETRYARPEFLPGGAAILFELRRGGIGNADADVAVLDLITRDVVIVAEAGTDPQYSPTGHVLFARDTSLFSVAFDLDTNRATGQPTPVLEEVLIYSGGASQFDIADDGTLVFVPPTSTATDRTLLWVDREGEPTPTSSRRGGYVTPAISPDGRRVAVEIEELDRSRVWILDLANDTITPLTADVDSWNPVWSPDGAWVAFASDPEGAFGLYRRRADFSGGAELLLPVTEESFPTSWSESGLLIFTAWGVNNIRLISVEGDRTAADLIGSRAIETNGRVSPNGRWIAYASDESGPFQLYVRPFPEGGRRYTISSDVGSEPVWSADGTELYYGDEPDQSGIMVVEVDTEGEFSHGPPRRLFSGAYFESIGPNYDVGSDGRFLMISTGESAEVERPRINVVLNWFEELKERVPTGR